MTKATRPHFELEDISKRHYWSLPLVVDLNADANGARCWNCDAALSWGQWLNAGDFSRIEYCHSCEHVVSADGAHEEFIPRSVFGEIEEADFFDRTWYHATDRKDWARDVRGALDGQLIVHAGDELTARFRADGLYQETGDKCKYYIHSFRLRSSKSMARVPLVDNVDCWQEELIAAEPMEVARYGDEAPAGEFIEFGPEGFRGAAYYNQLESPGEISILFHAGLIQLNTVKTVELTRSI